MKDVETIRFDGVSVIVVDRPLGFGWTGRAVTASWMIDIVQPPYVNCLALNLFLTILFNGCGKIRGVIQFASLWGWVSMALGAFVCMLF
jgi:hypothetical protein